MKIKEVTKFIESFAPKKLAYDWDNTGFQLGDETLDITKALICVDVNLYSVIEAIQHNCNLIISHHPLFFNPIKNLIFNSENAQVIKLLIEKNINVYSAHTNMDVSFDGLNINMAEKLELKNITPLIENEENLLKIAVYVPLTDKETVFKAVCEAGGGSLGNYSHATFRTEGIGTFLPKESANPYIGQMFSVNKVSEEKIEFIVEKKQLNDVMSAMLNAHPYEVPAYDIFPLENKVLSHGLGSIGEFDKPKLTSEVLDKIKEAYGESFLRTNDLRKIKEIKKIALVTGNGTDCLKEAISKGANLFITSDCKHHDFITANENGIGLIDVSHFNAEKNFIEIIENKLNDEYPLLQTIKSLDEAPIKTY